MGRSGQLVWVAAALAATCLPQTTTAETPAARSRAAAKTEQGVSSQGRLEDRIRVLERKLEEKEAATAEERGMRQRLDGVEKDVKAVRQSIAKSFGLEFHGLVATNYTYNFNTPDSNRNGIRVFDEDHNSINLDLANLHVGWSRPKLGVSAVMDLDFGKTAEVVGRVTRWSNSGSNTESQNSFELRQAYLGYAIPETPLSIQAGKFVTYHGAEIIKAYNNQNWNISNSILFGSSIPFTHTGLLATLTLPEELGSVSGGIVNGWDNVVDNNDSKSLHGMISLTPDPVISFGVSTSYGAEQNDSGRSKRLMVSPLLTVKPIDELTLIAEYNYGNESNVVLLGNGVFARHPITGATFPGNASWQGAAGYIVWDPIDQLQLAFRVEVFDDPDGVRTAFQEFGYGPGATFWEVTPTISYRITDGLTWRTEYRHDESDKHFFDKDNHTAFHRGQDTLATELLLYF